MVRNESRIPAVRAIELDPNDPQIYEDFSGWFLLPLGRIDETVQQLRQAAKADPLSPSFSNVSPQP